MKVNKIALWISVDEYQPVKYPDYIGNYISTKLEHYYILEFNFSKQANLDINKTLVWCIQQKVMFKIGWSE